MGTFKQEQDADSPLLAWDFAETSGNAVDRVGSVALVSSGTVTKTNSDRYTALGNAWHFNGGYATATYNFSSRAIITVEALIKLDSNNGYDSLLEYGNTQGGTKDNAFGILTDDGNNRLGGNMGTNPDLVWGDALSTRLTPGTPYLLHWVFDRTNQVNKLYLEGVLQSISATNHSGLTGNFGNFEFVLCALSTHTQPCATMVGDLAIYNGELSSGRITAHFNALANTAATPPVANFTGTPTSTTSGGSVVFTDSSTNTPTSWLWEKNSGSGWVNFAGSPTSQNPTETFS